MTQTFPRLADIPVAVIGMACRLPGADNLEQFWQLLTVGGCAVVDLPPELLDQELYYHPQRGRRGKSYAKQGAIISSRQFDARECPLPESLTCGVDNVHLLMCQTAAAACRHAGLDPFRLATKNTAVYIGHAQGSDLAGQYLLGTCIEEAAEFLRAVPGFQQLPADQQSAVIKSFVESVRAATPQRQADSPDLASHMVAGTISRAFGLSGPYLAVNSACASSLQAVVYGVRALQAGNVDMAIVGGASDCKSDTLVLFSHAQSLSEHGTRPFDAAADGLICSEGYVSLVLKTLDRALADGDPIQAVIRGLGASCDGKGKSLWAPRKEGQIKAMDRAYRNGLNMSSLQYIEAHATSTNLGDATELNALTEILGKRFPPGKKIPIASVKANIGHALESAGVASMIKTILCLQHRTFVPAINITSLNTKIDWAAAPFYIQRELAPWPEQPNGVPRRAGVNAFGIGGLNIHIVLEEFTGAAPHLNGAAKAAPRREPSAPAVDEPVAVIGMSCILPGALDIHKFAELLLRGIDPKTHAPEERLPRRMIEKSASYRPYRTPTSLGGYVLGYAYDWRKHKVPPKQVAEADPLQFMLLDAAEAAFVDAGYDKKPFDRERVGVLVGTEFGSDFSIQLGIGVKLPYLERLLQQILVSRGFAPEASAQIASQYSDVVLKRWPALVDESGSFSTSTLASRITKTMNLMGGAAAIDSGTTSAASALFASVDALRAGDCDMMICAAGQRCMSLATFEALSAMEILAPGEKPAGPLDAAARGIVPGEGVGIVLLKRLADARRDGDKVHAIIRGIGAAHSESPRDAQRLAAERALKSAGVQPSDVALVEFDGTGIPALDQEQLNALVDAYGHSETGEPLLVGSVTGQIGHTVGASAMTSLLKASIEIESGEMPATFGVKKPLSILAGDGKLVRVPTKREALRRLSRDGRRFAAVTSYGKGLAFHIVLERGEAVTQSKPENVPVVQKEAIRVKPELAAASVVSSTAQPANWRIYHLGAASAVELGMNLQRAIADPTAAFAAAETSRFAPEHRARLAVVAQGPEMLAQKLQAVAKQVGNPAGLAVLEQQGIFFRQVGAQRPKIAFVFPGQGSHYAGMLRELVRDVPAASAKVRDINAALARRGFPSFAQMAWENTHQLGTDVWVTQVIMLLADLVVHSAITSMGIRPDLVTGHSFGEFAALTAAGVWDLDSAIAAARARYEGIEATTTARGTMMATTAPPPVIDQHAATLGQRAYPANYNAPDQTVVGGSPDALQALAQRLEGAGHKCQMLPVPCPFHTPLMAGAGELLRRTLEDLPLNPPSVPVFSSVINRFVADPDDVRENLAAQLTTPVRWVDLINRLAGKQDVVLVEVGPQQALTRLNRRILENRSVAGVIAGDNPKRPGIEQLLFVRALLETTGALDGAAGAPAIPSATRSASATPVANVVRGTITHFDATERRREKMRKSAEHDTRGAAASNGASVPSAHVGENGHGPVERAISHTNGTNGDALTSGPVVKSTTPAKSTGVTSPSPAQASPAAAQPRKAAPAAADLEKFLITFVVDQTGYPPEVVELDADLEADLGIDSIKKAQLFGELAEYFDVQPNEGMTLDDFPTLRHVMNFLQGAPIKDGAPGDDVMQTVVVSSQAPLQPTVSAEVVPHSNGHAVSGAQSHTQGVSSQPAPVASGSRVSTADVAKTPAAPAADLEKFLVNFVVEQTGYPPEVVELDADLEADLGIDSIKKAQLFGELAEYFDVQPTEGMTLDDFPTLRHVMNFLQGAPIKETAPSNGISPTVMVSPPAPSHAAAAGAAGSSSNGLPPSGTQAHARAGTRQPSSLPEVNHVSTGEAAKTTAVPAADLEKFLVNFVVEQTGYPPEVVELDADLEADLGIDSIKKAQLFGELAEYFDVQPTEGMTLDDFPTLRHVVNFLSGATMKSQAAVTETVSVAPAPASGPSVASPVSVPEAATPTAPSIQSAAPMHAASVESSFSAAPSSVATIAALDATELEKFLVNFVVEQTGYPPEVVELDADLEADLGIDSIKKAQLFGELAEYFDVQPTEGMTLDDFPTLRHVVNFLAGSDLKKNVTPSEFDDGPATPFDARSVGPSATRAAHNGHAGGANVSTAPAVAEAIDIARLPLVDTMSPAADGRGQIAEICFDPVADPFLIDHKLRGRPLLPAVIGLEAMVEAVVLHGPEHFVALRDVRMVDGLAFRTDNQLVAHVAVTPSSDGEVRCQLVADFYNRAGNLLRKDRLYQEATVVLSDAPVELAIEMPEPPTEWQPFSIESSGPMYHGPSFHGVQGLAFDRPGGWGKLVALPLANMGGRRAGRDWLIPASLLDAAFYVCGIHCFVCGQPVVSLPHTFECVRRGRLPRDNEPCLVHFSCRELETQYAVYDFTVFGDDGTPIIAVDGYRAVMLRGA